MNYVGSIVKLMKESGLKQMEYRNYKKFNKSKFLLELDQELLKGKKYNTQNYMFTTFTDIFRSVLDKHVSLKTKTMKGKQAPMGTKVTMTRSRLKSKCNKKQSRENYLGFRKAKNYGNDLIKMTKNAYFEEMSKRAIINSKSPSITVKSFVTNKAFFTSKNITLKNKGKVSDNFKLTEISSIHYINIVENLSSINPLDNTV